MNVLFLTLLDFHSIKERGIYTDLLREFANDGHNVYIISPVEKRYNINTNIIAQDNVTILKLKIGNIQKTNLIEKGISTLTLEGKFKRAIKHHFSNIKFDLVIYTTPPITLQKAVAFVKKRDHASTYLLLKDIFPQNAIDLGILSNKGIKGILYRYFRNKELNLYDVSDYIGCMSQANVDYLIRNNQSLTSKKVEVCPNSLEPITKHINESTVIELRKKYSIPVHKTVFLYGGNLGKPQGVEFIIECLKSNEERENTFFVLVGSGTEYNKIQSYFSEMNPKNSKLINQLSHDEYEDFSASCDVGLIFLDSRFTIPNFPSRLLSYMQSSLPVLAATDANTDIKDIVRTGDFGYWSQSGDLATFNENVLKLCDKNSRVEKGKNANQYFMDHYTAKHSYKIIMKHFK